MPGLIIEILDNFTFSSISNGHSRFLVAESRGMSIIELQFVPKSPIGNPGKLETQSTKLQILWVLAD